jgi:Protein of unknown function (DUF998)
MHRYSRFGALAGVVVSPLVALALVVLTLAERRFLETSGWSPVHRTPVEWPSLLALGPYGSAVTATFVVGGGLVVVFAATLREAAESAGERLAAWVFVVAGVSLALEGFPADRPGATHESWHAQLHNLVYPLIPLSLVAASLALAFVDRERTLRSLAAVSVVAAPVFSLAIVATLFAPVAQLGRYFLFGAALVWLEAIALALARVPR